MTTAGLYDVILPTMTNIGHCDTSWLSTIIITLDGALLTPAGAHNCCYWQCMSLWHFTSIKCHNSMGLLQLLLCNGHCGIFMTTTWYYEILWPLLIVMGLYWDYYCVLTWVLSSHLWLMLGIVTFYEIADYRKWLSYWSCWCVNVYYDVIYYWCFISWYFMTITRSTAFPAILI